MSVSIVDIDDQRQKIIMKYGANNTQIKKIQSIMNKLNDKILKKQTEQQELNNEIMTMQAEYKNICQLFQISIIE
jgi:ribosomal protein S2